MVAQPANRRQRAENAQASKACDSEWARLRDIDGGVGCWDEKNVREWEDVAAEARKSGREANFGRLVELCHLKGAELPLGHEMRKYKGRVVFQGDQVKTQNLEAVMFQEPASCPATMQAGKAADCFGPEPGNVVMQADADQVCNQALFDGTPTWVRLLEEAWPESGKRGNRKLRNPVCRLKRALYGHPDAGGYWEQHCEKHRKTKILT